MLKKIAAYQKLLSKQCAPVNGVVMFLLLILISGFGNQLAVRLDLSVWLVCFYCLAGSGMAVAARGRTARTLPVSDHFVVANLMFVTFPFLLVVTWIILLFVFQIGALIAGDTTVWSRMIGGGNLLEVLFGAMLAMTVWFWTCYGAFHRSKRTRWCWNVAELLLGIGFVIGISNWIRYTGKNGTYRISELIWIAPVWAMMTGMLAVMIVSGVICYRGCLRLFRSDVKGQESGAWQEIEESDVATSKMVSGKHTLLIIAVFLIAVTMCIVFFTLNMKENLNSKTKEIMKINADDPSAYNDWESYWNDVPKELVDTYGQIFPELTSGAECTEYYAHVNESYGDDWTSISSVIRFAAITYSEEEYQKEIRRLADYTVTYEGEDQVPVPVNHLLYDTEKFEYDAYIASYDDEYQCEYALADADNLRIYYVYVLDDSVKSIPTKAAIGPKHAVKVISPEDANTKTGGFSVYSFQAEDGSYVEM